MTYSRLVLLAVLIFLPAICHADNSCPWINKATAIGALGGSEDSPMANVTEISATACAFTYHAESGIRELRITVEQAKDPKQTYNTYKSQCLKDASPLRAIGNEAVMCFEDKKGHAEKIIGRVRDNVFTIVIDTSTANDPFMSKETLMQKADLVAEQVSGNLF